MRTGTTPNPFGYRSQFGDDATSLLYLRARFFTPGTGRFLTRDIADFDLENPVDLNRYRYAASNPIDYYDPTGFMAAEYGGIAKISAENATILGYRAGRFAESWISCAGMMLMAAAVDSIIGGYIRWGFTNPVSKTGRKIWAPIRNKITVAFGWTRKAPIDIFGPDRYIDTSTEKGRQIMLTKAAMYRSAPRELSWAMSGRSVNGLYKYFGDKVAIFDGYFIGNSQNLADRTANHAERKIVRHANPPQNALLSVGASRKVCSSCRMVLSIRVSQYGGCWGPIGSSMWSRP